MKKENDPEDYVFVGFMFIGAGKGFLIDDVKTARAFGLRFGFFAMA